MVFPLGDSERTRILPIVTYVLIALNGVAFCVQVERGEAFSTAFAATPWEISHNEDLAGPFRLDLPGDEDPLDLPGRVDLRHRVVRQAPVPFPVWMTLLTALFLHGDLLHLVGNMLYLWIFGDNVEEVLGHVRFALVYLCCGVAGTLAQIAGGPDSYIPTLGASGAIAGVMGMYLIWFPYNRVRVLVFRVIVVMPAVAVIGLWIALQAWLGLGSIGRLGQVGGVAYLAHLGGAVAGLLAGLLFLREARALGRPTWFDRIKG